MIAKTNLLGRERLNVGVWPVGDGGVRVGDRLECLGVALHDARRQLHLGRLRLYLVGAVDVVVAGEEDQLLLSLSDLPEDEFTIGFPDIFISGRVALPLIYRRMSRFEGGGGVNEMCRTFVDIQQWTL